MIYILVEITIMALNKFMHPRNIYKTPPDFGKLAKLYPEFANVAKMDITGKITIDFKDPHALRVLTKCLLMADFSLNIEIPEDKLVPTIPLRLNYVLWIEDLLCSIKRESNISGVDIGTGACAIYPLLAAKKNKWTMVGTEADAESLLKAEVNIKRNNLQSLIELQNSSKASIVENLLIAGSNRVFDFCMCNPPFYSNLQELWESRSAARPSPKNGFTGSPQELITEGGELEFCRRLIKESKLYKNNILIYTTMIGHKCNMSELVEDLKDENIKYTHTEFCQGRVTRWGLAWTFQDYNLCELVPPRDKPRKKNPPIVYQLPEVSNSDCNLESVFNKIKSILQCLTITYKIINKCGNIISLNITAPTNTWSNQRRKRRLLKRKALEETKRARLSESEDTNKNENLISYIENNEQISSSSIEPGKFIEEVKDGETTTQLIDNPIDDDNKSVVSEPVVIAFVKLRKKENNIFFEMEYLDGSGGKESLHQIMQYIKNNWK